MSASHKRFITTGTDNLIVPGVAGQRIIVKEIQMYNLILQDVYFFQGVTIEEPALMSLPAGSGFTRQFNEDPCIICDAGVPLMLKASLGGVVRGYLKYDYVPEWNARIN